MQQGYHTRIGRPPKSAGPAQENAVEPIVIIGGRVIPHNCPSCGKGQDPEVLATREHFIQVKCRSCATKYQYIPPRTRIVADNS